MTVLTVPALGKKGELSSGVYWIYQASRDRALYVGSSANIANRIYEHKRLLRHGEHTNQRLQRTYEKYGDVDIQFLTLEVCAVEEMIEREQFWMDALEPVCNVAVAADSPMRGRRHSDETRRRIGEIGRGRVAPNKGKPMSDAQRQKLSIAAAGRVLSEETRAKMSKAHSGRAKSEEHKRKLSGRVPWNKGVKTGALSDATKLKMSIGRAASWRRKKEQSQS